MAQIKNLGEYISSFFTTYLTGERAVSPNTIKSYRDSWKELIKFMMDEYSLKQEKLKINDLTVKRVQEFLLWIERERKCSKKTRNLRLTAIRTFCKYVLFEDVGNMAELQKILELKFQKTPLPARKYMNADGIKLLLEQPDQDNDKGFRDLVILSLMFETGCRVQELVDFSVNSVSFVHETIVIVGKGNKARILNLSKDILAMLQQYLKKFGIDSPKDLSHPLFFNSREQRFTRQNITSILRKYAEKARVIDPNLIPENLTPHCIRHSRAMFLLQAKIPTIYIRDILGHSSVTTTEIYAKADTAMKREALEKAYVKVTPDSKPIWEGNDDLLKFLDQF